MEKFSVYIETSIISYLAAKPSRDLLTAACQRSEEGCLCPEICTPIEIMEVSKK